MFVAGGSRCGRDVIFREGFKFVFQKTLKCGEKRWICADRKVYKCRSYLRTDVDGQVLFAQDVHVHEKLLDNYLTH